MNKLRVLDLFSGIGGFSLGLHMAGGFETVAFCDCEPYSQKLLAKRFPGVPIEPDIKTLKGDKYAADVICGGFPCQPWSVAGQQRGVDDDRDLWPEMLRVITECRPRWVIGENVGGFVSNPLGLDRVLSDLEAENYTTRAFVVPACAVDAPHRRDRVWIVANAKGEAKRRLPQRAKAEQPRPRELCENVADAGCWNGQGPRSKISSSPQPLRWPVEPAVGRVANGIPGRVDRLRGLGNAVVPQVVTRIGRAIMRAEFDE